MSVDDILWTYGKLYYFPDQTPAASETCKFEVMVFEGILNEDWGTDEIYGLLRLYNLSAGTIIKRKTNVVSHRF